VWAVELKTNAEVFKKRGKELKDKMCWRNFKVKTEPLLLLLLLLGKYGGYFCTEASPGLSPLNKLLVTTTTTTAFPPLLCSMVVLYVLFLLPYETGISHAGGVHYHHFGGEWRFDILPLLQEEDQRPHHRQYRPWWYPHPKWSYYQLATGVIP